MMRKIMCKTYLLQAYLYARTANWLFRLAMKLAEKDNIVESIEYGELGHEYVSKYEVAYQKFKELEEES